MMCMTVVPTPGITKVPPAAHTASIAILFVALDTRSRRSWARTPSPLPSSSSNSAPEEGRLDDAAFRVAREDARQPHEEQRTAPSTSTMAAFATRAAGSITGAGVTAADPRSTSELLTWVGHDAKGMNSKPEALL